MGLPTFLFKEKFYTCRNSTCIVFRVVDRASRLGKQGIRGAATVFGQSHCIYINNVCTTIDKLSGLSFKYMYVYIEVCHIDVVWFICSFN